MQNDLDSSLDYIIECNKKYPNKKMMDISVKHCYNHCWEIVNYYKKQLTQQQLILVNKLKSHQKD